MVKRVLLGDVDWDAAFVRAVPKVQAAKNDAELAKAIGELLAELNDPATRVVPRDEKKPADVPAATWRTGNACPPGTDRQDCPSSTARSEGNVLVVNRFDPSIAKDFEAAIRGIREGKDEVLERAIAYINDGR